MRTQSTAFGSTLRNQRERDSRDLPDVTAPSFSKFRDDAYSADATCRKSGNCGGGVNDRRRSPSSTGQWSGWPSPLQSWQPTELPKYTPWEDRLAWLESHSSMHGQRPLLTGVELCGGAPDDRNYYVVWDGNIWVPSRSSWAYNFGRECEMLGDTTDCPAPRLRAERLTAQDLDAITSRWASRLEMVARTDDDPALMTSETIARAERLYGAAFGLIGENLDLVNWVGCFLWGPEEANDRWRIIDKRFLDYTSPTIKVDLRTSPHGGCDHGNELAHTSGTHIDWCIDHTANRTLISGDDDTIPRYDPDLDIDAAVCSLVELASHVAHELTHGVDLYDGRPGKAHGGSDCDIIYRFNNMFKWALAQRYAVHLCSTPNCSRMLDNRLWNSYSSCRLFQGVGDCELESVGEHS